MKLTEVRKQHSEVMRAMQNALTILQPITTCESAKRFEVYIKPENIEKLKTKSELISSAFCKVNVIPGEKANLPKWHPCYRPEFELVQFDGGSFCYNVMPEELINVKNRLTKVFKSIECYDKKFETIQKRRIFTEQKPQKCQTLLPSTLKSANSRRTPKTRAKYRTKKLTSWQKALKTIKSILRLAR
jgi:hypothetical protein